MLSQPIFNPPSVSFILRQLEENAREQTEIDSGNGSAILRAPAINHEQGIFCTHFTACTEPPIFGPGIGRGRLLDALPTVADCKRTE